MSRWAWAEIDLGAIEDNIAVLRDLVAPSEVWAVVKADAYGHGAVPVARVAARAGATGLCVALAQEGVELRDAGIDAPILVLSAQPAEEARLLVQHRLAATVHSFAHVDALVAAGAHDHPVHLKVDTGMRRVGCEPDDAPAVADHIAAAAPHVRLAGVFTHLPIADEPDESFTAEQVRRFDAVLAALAAAGHRPDVVHLANSAGALAHPVARRSAVRIGIAMYGISPGPGVDHLVTGLRPALSLRARISHVKRVRAGERVSYGLRHTFDHDSWVATLPIGYADGVPRRLSSVGGQVLIGGHRHLIVGVVTMDQLMVELGPAVEGVAAPAAVGDPVVLLGRQGSESITAVEWADRLGTIGYEIVCGISRRIERRVHDRGPVGW